MLDLGNKVNTALGNLALNHISVRAICGLLWKLRQSKLGK